MAARCVGRRDGVAWWLRGCNTGCDDKIQSDDATTSQTKRAWREAKMRRSKEWCGWIKSAHNNQNGGALCWKERWCGVVAEGMQHGMWWQDTKRWCNNQPNKAGMTRGKDATQQRHATQRSKERWQCGVMWLREEMTLQHDAAQHEIMWRDRCSVSAQQ